ncbi:beta strand repeat-containing protein, partial [Spirosoma arcticum]
TSGPLNGITFTQVTTATLSVDFDNDGDRDLIEPANNSAGRVVQQNSAPPILTSTIPADNATGVVPSTNITLTFNVSVSKGNGNLHIVRTSDNVIVETVAVGSSQVTGSGTTWVLDPNITLANSTAYALRADEEVFADADGRVFAGIFNNTTFNFTTGIANAPPTDIALTATSVAENQASGTAVGTLSTTDANTGQTFIYSLVTGAGSTDNASFQIVGSQLNTAAVFNFETKSSYLIRIRTTDSGSPAATYEESFTITVTNVNETPTISPQTFAVNENAANATVVGTVVAADPDAGATLSYSILSGNTGGAFTLVGNSLQVANTTALDFETTPTFSLSVRVSDGTLSATALVTVNLNNVAEGGLSISPAAPAAVCAGSPLNLTATATGFTPTNYTWSSTPAGFAASGASLTAFTQNAPAVNVPTTYTVTASATDGTTTAGASVTVLVNPTPTLTVVGAGANPTTCGASDGNITFTSTNLPNGVYSLTYTGAGSPKPVTVANNGFLLTGLAAGTYSDFSISNSGCVGSVTASRTLSDPAQPIANVGGSQAICSGSTATLSATATNGTGVWSVLSGPSTASSQFNNTASPTAVFTPAGGAGTYVLRWTVSNGACTPATGDVVVTVTAAPTLTAGAGTNPSACATATGSIAFTSTNLPDGVYSLTYTGAGSPKNVTVSGNAFSLTGLAAGTYSNFALTSNGCTGSVATAVTLNDPAAPTLTAGAGTNPSACATATGSIAFTSTNLPDGVYSLTYTGAGSPKTVTVSGNAFSLTGLAAGTYSNFSISNNGCVGSVATSVTLSDPAAPTVSLTNSGPLSCTNTSVTLTATAGLSSYTFNNGANQIGGAAGNTATVTNADVYQVIATDANGCTGTASTTVTSTADSPLAITAQPASASTVVIGATVTVSVSVTGTGPITYQWYKDNLNSPVASQTGATLTLMNVQLSDAGSYSIVATGPCNSVTSTAFTLTVNEPAPTNQPPTTTGIANQTATVGQAFSLDVASSFSDPDSQTLTFNASGLPGGLNLSGSVISGTPSASGVSTVTVTATDPGSLSVSTSFTITVNPASMTTTAPFAITGVTTISCTPVANRINLTFNPRYAGLNGQPISFSVANELSPTTAPGPYSLSLYPDNPVITLRATQTGTPGEVSFSYNWLAACNGVNPPTNQAPTTTGIANQNATVGQGFSLNVASSFSDPNGDALTFSASGLPAGLSLSGSVISGTPSASGVSTVTVTATDPGSLSVSTSFTITVNPASMTTTAPFAITGVTTISCTPVANRINLTFNPRYAGLNGQPISFSVANELSPTTAPGPYSLSLYPDNPVITLRATQTGTPGEVSFSYNWLAACNGVNPPTNQAPTTTGIANQNATVGQGFSLNVASSFSDPNGDALTFSASGLPAGLSLSGSVISGTPSASGVSTVTVTATDPGSLSVSTSFTITVNPASVVNAPFAITAVTTVSCVVVTAGQRQVSFTPQYSGTNGQPISFSVVNELSPTTNPGPYTLTLYTDNPVITLKARQTGTAGEASFSYNWLAACFPGARRGAAESTESLTVTVLGNPVQDETVRLEVRGAQHQPLRLRITDTGGQVLTDQLIEGQLPVERHTIKLRAQSSGLLLLQVSTPTQSRVIKLIKQ